MSAAMGRNALSATGTHGGVAGSGFMRKVSALKGEGYLVSSASVVLLAIPGWKSAQEDPLLMACLLLGMAASIGGMAFRWRSHRLEQAGQGDAPALLSCAARPSGAPERGEPRC
jgi:hypothetical protein